MGNCLKSWRVSTAAVWLVISMLLPAEARDRASEYYIDGVEFFDQAAYEKALEALQTAAQMEPDNLQYRYYIGLTRKAQGRDVEALRIIEPIIEKEPGLFINGFFEVADIHKRNRRPEAALAVLSRAAAVAPDNPVVHLDKGLAHRDLGQFDPAIVSFNRAMEVDPEMTQAAYYHIAAVYFFQKEFDPAEEMFQNAIKMDPHSSIAINARLSLGNLRQARKNAKPWYMFASLAWGYDSNVPLDPLQQVIERPKGQPSGKEDKFQYFNFLTGYKIINTGTTVLDLGYELRHTAYHQWVDNNLLGVRPHLYLRSNREPWFFRLQYDYSLWVEGGSSEDRDIIYLTFTGMERNLLRMHTINPGVTIPEPRDMATDISLTYQIRDYADPAISDSLYHAVELVQTFTLGRGIMPRVGYKYIFEDAKDERDGYRNNIGYVGVSLPFRWRTRIDAAVYYGVIDFNHNPAFAATGVRQDAQYRLTASVERPVSDNFRLKFYVDHTVNDSNVQATGGDPFEFRKDIYALILSAAF